jgi:hypothetical protein
MNIHIFGNSSCSKLDHHRPHPTFANILAEQYNLSDENISSASYGSEERILHHLKKTKSIDLAIIFHSAPAIFVPTTNNDFYPSVDFDRNNPNNLWVEIPLSTKLKYIKNIDQSNPEILPLDKEEFIKAFELYMKYFYTPDLNRNRYYGALIQIDQYVTAKKIPTIHLAIKEYIPSWFKFSSGIVDFDLADCWQGKGQWRDTYRRIANAVTPAGNRYIADKLAEYIEKLKK